MPSKKELIADSMTIALVVVSAVTVAFAGWVLVSAYDMTHTRAATMEEAHAACMDEAPDTAAAETYEEYEALVAEYEKHKQMCDDLYEVTRS